MTKALFSRNPGDDNGTWRDRTAPIGVSGLSSSKVILCVAASAIRFVLRDAEVEIKVFSRAFRFSFFFLVGERIIGGGVS